MSPRDNNKQVSAAVRILQQKRDASARATHLMVKNDSLITYEKAFLGQAAVKKFFIATFLERKIMSTKTSFKRIALVAASALAIAGFSAVPAHAALSTTAAVVTSSSATVYGAVGTAATATISLATTTAETTGVTATDTLAITPTISSQPAGGALTVGAPASGTVGLTDPIVTGNLAATGTTNRWTNTVSAGVQSLKPHTTVGTIPAFSATAVSTLSLTATVAGTYSIVLTPTGAATTNTPVTVTFHIAGLAYSLGDGAAVSPATTGNGIAGPANTVTVNATTNASNTRSLVTVSGAGATINSNAGTALTAGATSTIVAAGTNAAIIINTPQVGTVTVSQFYESGNGTGIYAATASKTVTITVGAAAVNGTLSVANSTSILDGTIGADNEAWSSITADEKPVVTAAVSSSLERAVIKVVLKDTLNNVMPDATGISATIAGPGLLAIGTTQQTAAVGRAVSSSTLASGTGTAFVSVYSDGTPGVSTITISRGTTVVSTETVTFYGDAAKYTATTNIVAAANGTTSTDVVTVCAVDSANVAVPGSTIYAFSGDTTVATITAGDTSDVTETAAIAASGTSMADHVAATAVGCVGFSIDALSQTTKPSVVLTFGDASTIAASTVTTTATVLVGSVAATTVALTSDAPTYTAGSKITLSLTFKDSVGRPIAYGPGTATLAAALTSSSNLGGAALFATANPAKLGVAKADVYAPLAGGTVTLTGTTGAAGTYIATAGAAQALALSLEVEGDGTSSLALDAANAATDAANNAYDEAQNATQAASDALAAVTALAAQVKNLIAMVKKLTAAVAKLKK